MVAPSWLFVESCHLTEAGCGSVASDCRAAVAVARGNDRAIHRLDALRPCGWAAGIKRRKVAA
jgi:hypothetical protein